MIGRACLDFEIGMDRSIDVNNGETHSVDKPLPRETGWRIQVGMILTDASGKSHVALARGMKAS